MIGDMGDKIKDILVGIVMAGLAGLGTIFPIPIPFAMHFVVLFSVLYHGQLLGQALFSKTRAFSSVFAGSWIFLSLIALVQTASFYLNQPLGRSTDAWSLILSIVIAQGICFFVTEAESEESSSSRSSLKEFGASFALVALAIALSASILIPAWRAGTTASIRTPWSLIPSGSLAAIGCLWVLQLIVRLWKQRASWIAVIDGISVFSVTASTPLIYRIGFGFDGFLHIASEKILLSTGTLQPKPFYYIGQYVFTTWLSRITDMPIASIDHWLVPVAAATCIPFCLFVLSRSQSAFRFFPLALLPLGLFITTTPQAFAYLIGFCALLFAMGTKDRAVHWLVPLILGVWSVAIHPLAGIPFLFGSIAVCIGNVEVSRTFETWMRRFGIAASATCAGFSIPALFYLLSIKQGTAAQWHFDALASLGPWKEILTHIIPSFTNHFVVWPAWSSLISAAIPLILMVCAVLSWLMLRQASRQAQTTRPSTIFCLFLISLSLCISYVILKSTGDFAFLIDYERGNYADRVFTLGLLFCLPAAMPWISAKLGSLRTQTPFLALTIFIIYGSVAAGLAYNALPRHDALVTGRGWSTSQADMEAVRFIDRQAGQATYGVLANQSVSAAAVSQLGFKRYAKDDVFFYPIPTGGPLYDQFLRLTYRDPNLDPIKDAAQLTQADEIYVVINDYWWNASQLNESLRAIAQDHWTFGDADGGPGSHVDVYRFPIKTTSN